MFLVDEGDHLNMTRSIFMFVFILIFADNEIVTICSLDQMKELNTLGMNS